MALFQGDEMVQVTTPDGRTVTLPRSVADAMAGLAPPPDPSAQYTSAPEAGAMPSPPSPVLMPTAPAAPDLLPSDDVARQLAMQPQEAQPDVQKPAAPVPAAPPQTPKQMGVAGAHNAQRSAVEEEREAAQNVADVEASAADALAYHQRSTQQAVNPLLAKRAQIDEANIAAQEKKVADIADLRKKIANTKIDREHDSPGLAMLGVLLASFGQAWDKKDGNPALDIYFKVIDRKVAGQMADLDNKKSIAGMMKDELAMMKDVASSRLAQQNLLISAELEKGARYMEELATRTSSNKIRAQAKVYSAQLSAKAAEFDMNAVKYQLEFDQKEKFHKENNATQRYGIASAASTADKNRAEDARQHDQRMGLERDKMAADMAKFLGETEKTGGAAKAKHAQDMQKLNAERGVGDIVTGEFILQPEGQAKVRKASQLEARAAEIEADKWADQTEAVRLRDQASLLRGDANTNDVWHVGGVEKSGDFLKKLSASQSALTLIDDILENPDKSVIGRSSNEQALRSNAQLLTLTLKNAYETGALDKGSQGLFNEITGGDPTKLNVGVFTEWLGNNAHNDGSLKALAKALEQGIVYDAKVHHYRGDAQGLTMRRVYKSAKPTPEEEDYKAVTKEKTPVERAEQIAAQRNKPDESNPLKKLMSGGPSLEKVLYPFGGGPTSPEKEDEAANSGTVHGLQPDQDKRVRGLIKKYQLGGTEAPGAKKQLIELANEKDRAPLARAVRALLKDEEPSLLKDAGEYKANIKQQLVGELKNDAINGSKEAKTELLRRQGNGDKEATKALDQVIRELRKTKK
jgi:hypothetical protein